MSVKVDKALEYSNPGALNVSGSSECLDDAPPDPRRRKRAPNSPGVMMGMGLCAGGAGGVLQEDETEILPAFERMTEDDDPGKTQKSL